MKKLILLCVILIALSFAAEKSNAQGYTAPEITWAFALHGNIAMFDAYGTDFTFAGDRNYGMIYGRGISAAAKFGLGDSKKNRITARLSWDAMVNDNGNSKIPFFTISPEKPATFHHFWTGAIGYEYGFNARCRTKQYLGAAITGTYVVSGAGSIYPFDNTFRMGILLTGGYEFALDKEQKIGLNIGSKLHLVNLLPQENDLGKLNDGTGKPGAGFWRKIVLFDFNVGLNLYSGVKSLVR